MYLNFDSDYVSDHNPEIPICTINGFMSHQAMNIWKPLKARRKVIELDSGGVKSAYDSAIDLFYQLKGGIVDYGLSHSAKHNHRRFGATYEGLYSEWNEDNPVHLIAHSFGGNTALLLQKLLQDQIFRNDQGEKMRTSSCWIKSITTISAPFNGSPIVYLFGYKEQGREPSFWSIGSWIYKLSYLWHLSATEWMKKHVFDFKIDHFALSPSSFLKSLLTGKRFDHGLDNASRDISFDRLASSPLATYQGTSYKSYATHLNLQSWSSPLCYLGVLISNYSMAVMRLDRDWSKNDGVVPLASQFHPGKCKQGYCDHSKEKIVQRGVWQVTEISDCSHLDVVPGAKNNRFDWVFGDYLEHINNIVY